MPARTSIPPPFPPALHELAQGPMASALDEADAMSASPPAPLHSAARLADSVRRRLHATSPTSTSTATSPHQHLRLHLQLASSAASPPSREAHPGDDPRAGLGTRAAGRQRGDRVPPSSAACTRPRPRLVRGDAAWASSSASRRPPQASHRDRDRLFAKREKSSIGEVLAALVRRARLAPRRRRRDLPPRGNARSSAHGKLDAEE